ncbi:hypothetical protein DY000_02003295 [Brassica cretica]|uniref:F-box associated domain-containing protein n=1 Tax=Brassica cretica TaxID=69181 RepID=A0ABQ7CDP9_BRACR|nr:hypothetical protein DY000_02003295 [Brassica cretica]
MRRTTLVKTESIWSVKDYDTKVSWMWRKFLKRSGQMVHFCKVEVRNGESTSFWYSSMGCLMDGTGPRGEIDMGIEERISYPYLPYSICVLAARHNLERP